MSRRGLGWMRRLATVLRRPDWDATLAAELASDRERLQETGAWDRMSQTSRNSYRGSRALGQGKPVSRAEAFREATQKRGEG
jgi:hypothetical protein